MPLVGAEGGMLAIVESDIPEMAMIFLEVQMIMMIMDSVAEESPR